MFILSSADIDDPVLRFGISKKFSKVVSAGQQTIGFEPTNLHISRCLRILILPSCALQCLVLLHTYSGSWPWAFRHISPKET